MKARITIRRKTARGTRRSTRRRGPLQRDVLRDVMLSAAECDAWLTLDELGRLTSYPPASISAQLRHLRKTRHGGYRLKKRCRLMPKPMAGVEQNTAHGPLWEYGLDQRRSVTRIVARKRVQNVGRPQAIASA